jgi:hypothetical protein
MDWNEAQTIIRATILPGTNVNTPDSTQRFVLAIDAPMHSSRYGYRDERGVTVSIGRSAKLNVPWTMLKECFAQLSESAGYDGAFFRSRYPLQAKDHPCHVHVVGQLLVYAGLADRDGSKYLLRRTGT